MVVFGLIARINRMVERIAVRRAEALLAVLAPFMTRLVFGPPYRRD